jgi:hypothetical protein
VPAVKTGGGFSHASRSTELAWKVAPDKTVATHDMLVIAPNSTIEESIMVATDMLRELQWQHQI